MTLSDALWDTILILLDYGLAEDPQRSKNRRINAICKFIQKEHARHIKIPMMPEDRH